MKRKISYWNYQLEILFPEEHPSLPGKTGLHDNLVATDHYYHCIAIYLHMFCFSECRKLFQVLCYSFSESVVSHSEGEYLKEIFFVD